MTAATQRTSFVARLPFVFAGLIVWAVRFAFVYGFAHAACDREFAAGSVAGLGVVPAFMVATAIIAIALDLWFIALAWSRWRSTAVGDATGRFTASVGGTVAGLSIIAIVFETAPAFVLPVCP